MTDSTRAMISSVGLRVRLVYEAAPPKRPDPAAGPSVHHDPDVPGWRLVGLLPEDISLENAGLDLDASPTTSAVVSRFATDPIELALHRDEAEGYYLNLTSPQPSVFALIRVPEVGSATASHAPAGVPEAVAITASYNEACRWMDGGMVVIRAALPEPLLGWIAEFAQHHFKVEVRRKGGKVRPSFLSRQQFGEVARAAQDEAGRAAVTPAVPPDGRRH